MADDVEDILNILADGEVEGRITGDPKQEREIVTPEEFISDPYYTGSVSSVIYPFWREKFIDFMEDDSKYEIIVDGSTSSGKTWSSVLMLFYKFYTLTCYKYPQRLFNFSDETWLGFYYFNVKQKIAKRTGYKDLRGFFEESQYFKDKVEWNKRKTNSIELPKKNLVASFGATESDIKGVNLLGIVLDETNFFKKSGNSAKADLQRIRAIYTDAIDRITQRFHTEDVKPGLAAVISSATQDDSFIEERKEATGEHIYYVKAVKHKVNAEEFSKDRFWVFGGTERVDPTIINSIEHLKKILEDTDLSFDPSTLDGCDTLDECIEEIPTTIRDRFDNPPEDWRDRYEYDIESALKNRSGIPTGKEGKLFTNKEKWKECEEDREFPFYDEEPIISTESAKPLDHYFKPEVLCDKRQVSDDIYEWMPKVNPGAPRFVYGDLSATTDPSGLSMAHICDEIEVEGSGMTYPIVYVDFMLRIQPPEAPARLDHDKVLDFVGALKNKFQFDVKGFGTDTYAGETTTQRLNKSLFKADDEEAVVLGMDASGEEVWIDFTRLLYKGFVRFGKYWVFKKEFLNLEHNRVKGKIDHPDKFPDGSPGTKDVSDSVVGATTLALEHYDGEFDTFPESSEELLDDGGLVDDEGNVDISQWRGSNNEQPFLDKEEVLEDQLDNDIIDLL